LYYKTKFWTFQTLLRLLCTYSILRNSKKKYVLGFGTHTNTVNIVNKLKNELFKQRFGSKSSESSNTLSIRKFFLVFDSIRFVSIRLISFRFDWFRFDSVRFGSIRFDSIRFDSVRFGSIRFDSVRFGSISIWYALNSRVSL